MQYTAALCTILDKIWSSEQLCIQKETRHLPLKFEMESCGKSVNGGGTSQGLLVPK